MTSSEARVPVEEVVAGNPKHAEDLMRLIGAGPEYAPPLDLAGITNAKQRAFLKAYGVVGVMTKACQLANVHRSTYQVWMRGDPIFRQKAEEALAIASELTEAEVYRRAVEGVLEPVYYEGRIVGVKRVFSDSLLRLLMEARMPEKYSRRHRHEVSGPEGAPIAFRELKSDEDCIQAAFEWGMIDKLPPRLREKAEALRKAG